MKKVFKMLMLLGCCSLLIFSSGCSSENQSQSQEFNILDGNIKSYKDIMGFKFDRADYTYLTSVDDLVRNAENDKGQKVYIENYDAISQNYTNYYLMSGEYTSLFGTTVNSNDFYYLDTSGVDGTKPIVEDKVSVYGSLSGTDRVYFEDGTSKTVPVIVADKVLVTNIAPTDLEDFTKSIVHYFNRYKDQMELGYHIKYISDSTFEFIIRIHEHKSEYFHYFTIENPLDEYMIPDGYITKISYTASSELGLYPELDETKYKPGDYICTIKLNDFEPLLLNTKVNAEIIDVRKYE